MCALSLVFHISARHCSAFLSISYFPSTAFWSRWQLWVSSALVVLMHAEKHYFHDSKGQLKLSASKGLITDCWFFPKCHVYIILHILGATLPWAALAGKKAARYTWLWTSWHYKAISLTQWGLKRVSGFCTPACRMDIRAIYISPIIINTIPAIKMDLKCKKENNAF